MTGANRGIGLEVCRQLARRGYAVVLGSRDAAKGERAAAVLAEDGRAVHSCQLDVTDPESIERVRRRDTGVQSLEGGGAVVTVTR